MLGFYMLCNAFWIMPMTLPVPALHRTVSNHKYNDTDNVAIVISNVLQWYDNVGTIITEIPVRRARLGK